MKKILAVLMSLVLALSFVSFAFAAKTTAESKTEAFIQNMEDGIGVKANWDGMLSGELYVKKDRAVATAEIGSLSAKAILDDDKLTAYIGIFSADLTELIDNSSMRELKGIVNEVPETFADLDTGDYFKYLKVADGYPKEEGGYYVEKFGPDYEEIGELIVEENRDALEDKDAMDIKEFCEFYAATDEGFVGALLRSSATFKYEDADYDTLVGASITFPKDESSTLETIDIFSTLRSEVGVKIDFITVDIKDSVFNKPFSILNITWIIKLIIKMA